MDFDPQQMNDPMFLVVDIVGVILQLAIAGLVWYWVLRFLGYCKTDSDTSHTHMPQGVYYEPQPQPQGHVQQVRYKTRQKPRKRRKPRAKK